MISLETKLIIYGVFAFAILIGIGWSVHEVDSWHYTAVAATEQKARDAQIQAAQQNVIRAQAAQQKAEDDAKELRTKLDATNTVARDAALGSLRNVQTAIHTLAVSASMANSSGIQGRGTDATGDRELEAAFGRLDTSLAAVNDAVAVAIQAAQHDSANYTSILKIEPDKEQ